ncbi:MAG: DNA translocase FtsK, partial [Flavobacteriales bacterium]|nr:DNA translocase FtsK [Flavobacteriales bacterium]
ALISHHFIYKWFGVAAFATVLWSFIGGIRVVLGTWLLPRNKTFRWTVMSLFWVPTLLGFFFAKSEYMFLGGGIGYAINAHLGSWLGGFGAGALILFSAAAFAVYTFNPSFAWLNAVFERKAAAHEDAATEGAEVETDTQGWSTPNKVRENVMVAATTAPTLEMDVEEPIEEELPLAASDAVELELDSTVEEEEEPIDEEVPLEMETVGALADSAPVDPILPSIPLNVGGMSVAAPIAEEVLTEAEIERKLQEFGEYDPKLDLASYELPPIDLLVDHGTGELTVTKEELEANKNRIVETLSHYNIGIDKIKATIGPTVTLYEIIPQAGVRISKIKNLEDDIALSLAALGIRIIAPIPGKGTIGIEVPNSKPQVVGMRAVIASEKFQNTTMDLPIVLGKTITNETFVTDLTKMPHLLMAGATGQGKSVGLNAILVSLLYKKHPSQIKFVLVDPKKVELTLFNKIERHFLAKLPGEGDAIITDTKKVVATLN